MTQNSINNTSSDFTVDNLFLDGNTLSSLDTNGDIVLAPDGSGVISVTSSPIVPSGDRAENLGSTTNAWDNLYCDGISFDDGTNVWNHYSTGTWTPTVAGSSVTGTGTYTSQTGSYIRIYQYVFISFDILWTSHSGSGDLLLQGVPFTLLAGTSSGPVSTFNSFSNAGILYMVTTQNVPTYGDSSLIFTFIDSSGSPSRRTLSSSGGIKGSFIYRTTL